MRGFKQKMLIKKNKNWLKGFTVVEMIIVFAVMTIMLGLLLPALRNVSESGRRSTCLSNLTQLHKGFMLYAADYTGWLPGGVFWEISGGGGESGDWSWMLAPYIIKEIQTTAGIQVANQFLCPRYVLDHKNYTSPTPTRTYAMSEFMSVGCWCDWPILADKWPHLDKVNDHANTILLAPVFRDTNNITNGYLEENSVLAGDRSNCDSSRHGTGANYLMVDGNVRFLRPSKIVSDELWDPED